MRSAFSAAWLQQELHRRGVQGITVDSFGVSAVAGKKAEPDARDAAQRFGISLENHRAQRINAEHIAKADLIFIMDRLNQVRLEQLAREAKPRTWLLGTLHPEQPLENGGYEISDPYSQGPEETYACFETLVCCLDSLAARLEAGNINQADAS